MTRSFLVGSRRRSCLHSSLILNVLSRAQNKWRQPCPLQIHHSTITRPGRDRMASRTSAADAAPKRLIDETKRLYSLVLAKPLDERQLARPSFKLIQEIVKSLITETKMLRQVFNASDFEQPGDAKWNKRRRADFVQRLIDFAANHKQPVVGCVAAKLVSGLDPSKCNELLQALAKIAASQQRQRGQPQDSMRPRTFTRGSQPDVAATLAPASGIKSRPPIKAAGAPQAMAAGRAPPPPGSRQSSAATKRASRDDGSANLKSSAGSRRTSASRTGAAAPTSASSSISRRSPSNSPPKSHRQFARSNDQVERELTAPISPKFAAAAPDRSSSPKSASTSGGRPQPANVADENDSKRTIQALLVNMRSFQSVLQDIGQLDDRLRARLVEST